MRNRTTDIAFIAVFAALISVFSQFIIPLPSGVPFTLQTFTIAVTGYVLGSLRGSVSVLIYIVLGLIGIPVFTGFQVGLSALAGFTGGFIIGFLPLVFMCGINTKSIFLKIIFGLIGVILCHVSGVIRFADFSGDIRSAFFAASVPYILKDVISIVLAAAISGKIKRAITVYTIQEKRRKREKNNK